MVNTWATHKTTEAVLNSGWRLVAVGGWRLVAVGGWQLVVLGGCPDRRSLKQIGVSRTALSTDRGAAQGNSWPWVE